MRRSLAAVREPAIIADINTTPLIDVMLVLLVMLVMLVMLLLTLPVLTHKLPIDLPQPGPAPVEQRITHALAIDADGRVTLDGADVTAATLAPRLAALARDPRTELTVRTDPAARYADFAETLAVVKRSGIDRLGFVGNQAMAR